jgi:hypothetical protein
VLVNYLDFHVLPDIETPEAAEILVNGNVDSEEYEFLIDTGAALTTIVSDKKTINFRKINDHETGGAFRAARNDLVVLPTLQIGPIIRKQFPVVRLAEGTAHRRSLLGMDILKDYCCHFLFGENRVGLDSGANERCLHDLVTSNKCHPYVQIEIGQIKANAVWDSGAGITVVDTAFISQNTALFESCGCSLGTDAAGGQNLTPEFMMKPSRVGDICFDGYKVVGIDLCKINLGQKLQADFILGYNFIKNADWIFDFPRKQWKVSPLKTSR